MNFKSFCWTIFDFKIFTHNQEFPFFGDLQIFSNSLFKSLGVVQKLNKQVEMGRWSINCLCSQHKWSLFLFWGCLLGVGGGKKGKNSVYVVIECPLSIQNLAKLWALSLVKFSSRFNLPWPFLFFNHFHTYW